MAFDLGMDRPRIATVEEWNGAQAYILTFGSPAYRKTAILRPSMNEAQVRETLILAKAEEVPKLAAIHKDAGPFVADIPMASVAKPQKRKAAKSRA
jgi:hypothetical protein